MCEFFKGLIAHARGAIEALWMRHQVQAIKYVVCT